MSWNRTVSGSTSLARSTAATRSSRSSATGTTATLGSIVVNG